MHPSDFLKPFTASKMPECGFFLTCIFPCKDRIYDSVLIREKIGQTNPYSGIFYAVFVPCFHSRKVIMCEHRGWKSINCGTGEKIEMTTAYYGRKSLKYCGRIRWYNTRCVSSKSVSMIKNTCNGKQSCRLLPSNGYYGDPCRFTVKYIEADYRCVRY